LGCSGFCSGWVCSTAHWVDAGTRAALDRLWVAEAGVAAEVAVIPAAEGSVDLVGGASAAVGPEEAGDSKEISD
jgi:hypothetical protein